MKSSVQTNDFRLLEEVAGSGCDAIRFGSEFCEYGMPTLNELKKAHEIVEAKGKEFTYVTPRLSNGGIEKLRKQLTFLDGQGKSDVVINDYGALNIIEGYPNLSPHLGRQMVRLPARSPWARLLIKEGIFFKPGGKNVLTKGGFMKKRWYRRVFSSSSLDFQYTVELLLDQGVRRADVDWIPYAPSAFDFMKRKGFDLSVHLQLAPVAFTRRCHTARFLGESSLEKCSRPCSNRAFLLRNELCDLGVWLNGNAVFNYAQPIPVELKNLKKGDFAEFVVTTNPITGMTNREKIDEFIALFNN
jgi:hypothetical protein